MKRDDLQLPVNPLAPQPISTDVLREKYLKGNETEVDDVFQRVALALASVEKEDAQAEYKTRFLNNLYAGAIGAGRIMSAAGTDIQATLINCFVQPVGDCIQGVDDEGFPGIYEALREAAETMRRGGGVGYDFSRIRPKGALVRGTASMASGPCSYINVFDQSCSTVESAGARRGAQMGVLRIDHPDVEEFITAKRTPGRWNNFNVSIGVTNAFMQAVVNDGEWQLVHRGEPNAELQLNGAYQREDNLWVYRTVQARDLWETVMQSAYDFAEPGILFLDNINQDNNLNYCETISTTNPCVTADTWVMTDTGARQVSELIGKPFNALVNGQIYAVESQGFFATGTKSVLELQTQEGHRLRLTGDHRVRRVAQQTRYSQALEWVAAAELQAGDQIVLHDHRANLGWDGPGTEAQGYRMGLLLGDGTPQSDQAVMLGLQPNANTITPAIEHQSSDFYAGLLRGLFDADGSVQDHQNKGVSVCLSKSDEAMLRCVQRMLQRLGIISTICTEQTPAQHELLISGENLRTFADRVGFAEAEKAQRLQAAFTGYKRDLNRERFTATVSALVPCGQEMVYDVTVSDVHAFDANGLVVHNCGEQPLPAYGCCDLGPIILPRFVRHAFDIGGEAYFDFEAFEQVVALQVRALDNVLDLTWWPLPQQRQEAQNKRRIGVGFTGMGNTLTMLNLRYDSQAGRGMAACIAEVMRNAAYEASIALAQEKGPFPLFEAEGYLQPGNFASRLPESIQAAIRQHGIRNSHLLSIAPTGTVSLAFADNASNGIEPAFSWTYTRKKREADGSRSEYQVQDHAWRVWQELGGDPNRLPESFVSALDMKAEDHIGMMEAVQPYIDTAISKTVNVPADYPYDSFKDLYLQAWNARLKGLATYRPNSILGAVLEVTSPSSASSTPAVSVPTAPIHTTNNTTIDPMRTVIESRPKGALSAVAEKLEYWTQEGQKTLYLIVSFLPISDGNGKTVDRAVEFFMPVGQNGESQQWITSSMRLLSLAARGGFLERALSDMRKVAWDRGPVRLGTHEREDGVRIPMWHDSEVAAIAYAIQNILALRAKQNAQEQLNLPLPASQDLAQDAGMLPVMAGKKCHECGAHAVIKKDGCEYCTQCGHTGSCG